MAWQTGRNVLVATRAETTTGVAATVTGAVRVRLVQSEGLKLDRAQIRSAEIRADGLQSQGRLGGKSVSGGYSTEWTAGGACDVWLEAVMRGTWATAVVVGFATMTTVAIGSNTITATGGDWVGGQGLRVGDVFTITGTTMAANNNVRAQITALSSTVITVATGVFSTNTGATATGTITIAKKLINAATPSRRSFTVEQYDQDIDLSELFLGCRVVGLSLSMKPGAPVTAQWTLQGLDHTALATNTSPYFTTPTLTTTAALIADDSAIRYNGAAVANLTGFDLNFQITAAGVPVIGSWVSPDIFDNDLAVTGTVTGLRQDFSNLTLYDAETEFEILVLLKEPTGTPPEFFSIHLPRVKLASLAAPVGGGDAAKVETLGIMVGPKAAATGYDATIATFCSSGA